MYRMLKKIAVCGSLILTLSISGANAANVKEARVEIKNEIMTVEGCLADAKAYENVSVEVYRPGYGPESIDLTSEDYLAQMKKAVFWMGQVNSSRDNAYSVSVDMKGALPGEYPVRISVKGADMPYETSIFYSSPEQQKELIDKITKSATAGEVKEILGIADESSLAPLTLGLTDPLIFSANPDNTASILFEYKENNTIDVNDIKKFNEILLLCSLADNLTQGNRFDITQYSNLFDVDEAFTDTYDKRLTDSAKKSFTESFKGLEIRSGEDIATAFSQRVFLALVNNIQNWSDIKHAIKTHGDHASINLDTDEYENCSDKEELCVELAKDAPYSSIDAFNDNLKKEAKKIKTQSSKGSSSSGGGGGGGGRISMTTTPDIPSIPADEFVPHETPKTSFKDIDSVQWAKESIEYLLEKNIVSGTGENTFEPERKITREEFVKMLISAFSVVSEDAQCSFTDVSEDSWFLPYVATAESLGVLKGYPDGRMGTGEHLTREDIAALACRMANLSGIDLSEKSEETFPDDSLIAPYAKDAVYAMKHAGVISGMGNGTFAPKEHCTRAQAAKIIYELIKLEGDR